MAGSSLSTGYPFLRTSDRTKIRQYDTNGLSDSSGGSQEWWGLLQLSYWTCCYWTSCGPNKLERTS